MTSNFFTRLFQRGRQWFRGRRRKTQPTSPSLLRLEPLEDRRLLSAGFGGLSFLERFVPVTIEISVQRSVVSQPSITTVTFSPTNAQGLFSFLGQLSQQSQTSDMTANGASNGGATSDGLATQPGTTAGSESRNTQPVATTTTVVQHSTLVLPTFFLSAGTQTNPQPTITSPIVPVTPSVNVNVSNLARTSASISLISGASSAAAAALTNPEGSPSSEIPSAPMDSRPAIPPALPEPAPTMPAIPPGAAAVTGMLGVDLDTHVFAQVADLSPQVNVPAEMFVMAPSREQHNAPLPAPVSETAILVGAPDAILTQVALGTAQETTDAAKERLTPAVDHWAQFVAPLFVAAGTYIGSQTARRTKSKERPRPALLPNR